jgi:nitrogen regulatory protein PII-like uncharacterized protein
MMKKYTPVLAMVCFALILMCALFSAGCTSMPASEKSAAVTTPAVSTPAPTTLPALATPLEPVTAVPTTLAGELTTVTLADGVTISYPADWQKEEFPESSLPVLRDYGRATVNIANLYSPDITTERQKLVGANPDASTYTTLSIDVDPTPVSDFEQYFNLVTLSLQKTYGSITITKHNYQLDISKTDSNPEGYDAYQMDFDTKTLRGKYIFADVDGTVYIFAFRNPTPYSSEVEEMYKSIVITPVTTSTKHR